MAANPALISALRIIVNCGQQPQRSVAEAGSPDAREGASPPPTQKYPEQDGTKSFLRG
jgi:hypothetical protein